MSDSQPPVWGPEPYDDGDLDAVLSGEAGGVPGALRPLAATLTALRAAPVPGELDHEAAARAAFLQHQPARLGPALEGPRSLAPAHRHRRPAPARKRGQAAALLGLAAAVAGFAVLAIALSVHGAHPGQPGQGSGTTPALAAPGSTAKPALDGGATRVPSPRPTPKATVSQPAAAGPAALCRQLSALLTHPGQPSDLASERKVFQRLSTLAGGPGSVFRYCYEQVGGQSGTRESTVPRPDGNPGYPFAGGAPGRGGVHSGSGGLSRDRSSFGGR